MRCFIGIFPPKEILEYFYNLQSKLKQNLPAKIKWTSKSQIHLTLKFLGEVPDNNLSLIKEELSRVKFNGIETKLDKIGTFPNENRINVIWIGLKPDEKIIELQKKTDEVLIRYGDKQKFSSHITLGRVKFVKDKENFIKKLKMVNIEKREIKFNEFKLIKSTLTKDGANYEILEAYNLD